MNPQLDLCPFAVLGVSETADAPALKAAYRRGVRRHHPDRGGDAEDFAAFQRAWDVVHDPLFQARHPIDSGCPCKAAASPDPPRPNDAPSQPPATGVLTLRVRDLIVVLAGAAISTAVGFTLLAVPCALMAVVVAVLLLRGERIGTRAALAKVATIVVLAPVAALVLMAALVVVATLAVLAIIGCLFIAVS